MCNIDKFPTTIQMLNNELASYTWARLTWEQRVTLNNFVAVPITAKATDQEVKYYPLNSNSNGLTIWCETLSQMQF